MPIQFNKRVSRSMRVREDIIKAMQEFSARDNRSLNNLIETALLDYIQRRRERER